MADQSDLQRLAESEAQQRQGLQLPNFPKLSEYAPKLAAIDPEGVQRWQEAIEQQWKKNMTYNIRGGA